MTLHNTSYLQTTTHHDRQFILNISPFIGYKYLEKTINETHDQYYAKRHRNYINTWKYRCEVWGDFKMLEV